jgi:hypothetical protein
MTVKYARVLLVAAMFISGSGAVMAQSAAPAVAGSVPQLSAPVAAQTEAKHPNPIWQKYRAACAAELKTHCGDVERIKGERGRMRACLDTHRASLGKECLSALTERDAAAIAKKS